MPPADPLAWAKFPRSREAITAVHDLARRDRVFRAIWEQLLQEGVASATGKPLRIWNGNDWIAL